MVSVGSAIMITVESQLNLLVSETVNRYLPGDSSTKPFLSVHIGSFSDEDFLLLQVQ
jgi:hypothetical protein